MPEACGNLTAFRRLFGVSLLIVLCVGSAFGWPEWTLAQTVQETYPTKPIMLSVGFSAGSTNDTTAREMARQLTESLGQQVVVVNREGAAGAISIGMVAKAKPDGYTLVWATAGGLTVVPAHDSKISYDPMRDFAPISVFFHLPFVLVLQPGVPARDLKEFIAFARANPGKLNFGSTGVGGLFHLAVELIRSTAGIDMVHVPYRGTPSLMIDLLGGQIDLAIMPTSLVAAHIQSGKLRAIGVTGIQRSVQLPDVPTISEAGLHGYDMTAWYGMLAPAGTPKYIISILHKAFIKGLEHPNVKAIIAQEGGYAGGNTPEQFSTLIREELAKYTKLIKNADIKSEGR
jgi:tripartite-type tricarboxylate transporter receptor subunit TctC